MNADKRGFFYPPNLRSFAFLSLNDLYVSYFHFLGGGGLLGQH